MGFDGAAFNGQCPDPTACSLTLTHMLTSTFSMLFKVQLAALD